MAYGLTANGFEIKDLATVKADLEASYKTEFGNSINLQAQAPLGQIIGIHSERLAFLWELAQAVYQAVDPNTAEDISLDKACALVMISREAATYSTVGVTLTGTIAAVIPAGTQFAVFGNEDDAIFALDADVTIGGGGTGTGTCTATTTGAIDAPIGTLTVIKTPVSGLTSVTNAAGATLGSAEETDAELRIRRNEQLQQSKKGTLEAIRSALLDVANVEAVAGYENTTNAVVDGRPSHCFEMVIKGGTDAAVATAIWLAKPAGIASYGTDNEPVTDSQGDTRTIYFSRPDEKRMYVIVNITKETGATITSAQVKAAINVYEAGLNMGDDVLPVAAMIPVIMTEVDGIRDIEVLVSMHPTTPPTVDSPITIAADEIATFADADMTINIT